MSGISLDRGGDVKLLSLQIESEIIDPHCKYGTVAGWIDQIARKRAEMTTPVSQKLYFTALRRASEDSSSESEEDLPLVREQVEICESFDALQKENPKTISGKLLQLGKLEELAKRAHAGFYTELQTEIEKALPALRNACLEQIQKEGAPESNPGGGDCFFHSIRQGLLALDKNRERGVDHLRSNLADYMGAVQFRDKYKEIALQKLAAVDSWQKKFEEYCKAHSQFSLELKVARAAYISYAVGVLEPKKIGPAYAQLVQELLKKDLSHVELLKRIEELFGEEMMLKCWEELSNLTPDHTLEQIQTITKKRLGRTCDKFDYYLLWLRQKGVWIGYADIQAFADLLAISKEPVSLVVYQKNKVSKAGVGDRSLMVYHPKFLEKTEPLIICFEEGHFANWKKNRE